MWTKKFGRIPFYWNMAVQKEHVITRTPFKKQASVISSLLATNSIINDDERASLNETVGVLTWMNELQKHWADGGKDIPENIKKHLFESRPPQKTVAPTQA